ncbi:MAG: phage shock protein [Sphingomonadales bacterium]|jgi:phage shock protein C|nr:phage shock protein [Sphingomonadales bacterium]
MAYNRYPAPQERSNRPVERSDEPHYVSEPDYYSAQPASRTRFYRDKRNGKLFGVCAGIADYTGFDVSLVRVCFLAAMFMSGGGVVPFYFIAAMVTPTKPRSLERVDREETQFWQGVRASPARAAREISSRLKDVDRRLADIESYVTTENRSLAREIEALAIDKGGNA